jgi:drug/metabolite transporter (DMT)-like permease
MVSLIWAASLDLLFVCLWWLGIRFPGNPIPMRFAVSLLLPGLIVTDHFFVLGHSWLGSAVAAVINSMVPAAVIFCIFTARDHLKSSN